MKKTLMALALLAVLLAVLESINTSVMAQTPVPPTGMVESVGTAVITQAPAEVIPTNTPLQLPAYMLETKQQSDAVVLGASLLSLLIILGVFVGLRSKKRFPPPQYSPPSSDADDKKE